MSSCSASMSDGHARDEPAGLLPLVEVHRQAHEVTEHALAQLPQEPLAGPAHQPDDRAAGEQAEDRDRRGTRSPPCPARRRRRRAARSRRRTGPARGRRAGSWSGRSARTTRARSASGTAAASATAGAGPGAPAPGRAWSPRRRGRPRPTRPSCRRSLDRGRPRASPRPRAPSRYRAEVASSSSCVPSATTTPSSSSTTRSASAIVAGRWAMMIVVRPAMTSPSAARISCSLVGSTDDVASSRIRTLGSAITARAIAMRCRWPPESENPCSPMIVS